MIHSETPCLCLHVWLLGQVQLRGAETGANVNARTLCPAGGAGDSVTATAQGAEDPDGEQRSTGVHTEACEPGRQRPLSQPSG